MISYFRSQFCMFQTLSSPYFHGASDTLSAMNIALDDIGDGEEEKKKKKGEENVKIAVYFSSPISLSGFC